MAERPDFMQKQLAFAAHIRDPDNVPAPEGIEDRRMAIYRELFFNNLKSLLGNTFPVLRKLYGDAGWRRLIREFLRGHRARTPYFPELPAEFVDFLESRYRLRDDDYPFLVELAHYEYVELALSVADTPHDPWPVDPDGDLLEGVPVKSALARVCAYRWPVHRISPAYLPDEPLAEPVWLAVWRRPDDTIGFLELNAVTAGLLDGIDRNTSRAAGRELLEGLADAIGYTDREAFVRHGAKTLAELRELGIVIGTRRPEEAISS